MRWNVPARTASAGCSGSRPERIRALGEIIHGTRTSSWQPVRLREDREIEDLAAILRAGQHAGELDDFDPVVMARSVRHALNGLLDAWAHDPGLDLEHYTDELLRLFAAATRKQGDATRPPASTDFHKGLASTMTQIPCGNSDFGGQCQLLIGTS
jgi:hypothetical protein